MRRFENDVLRTRSRLSHEACCAAWIQSFNQFTSSEFWQNVLWYLVANHAFVLTMIYYYVHLRMLLTKRHEKLSQNLSVFSKSQPWRVLFVIVELLWRILDKRTSTTERLAMLNKCSGAIQGGALCFFKSNPDISKLHYFSDNLMPG